MLSIFPFLKRAYESVRVLQQLKARDPSNMHLIGQATHESLCQERMPHPEQLTRAGATVRSGSHGVNVIERIREECV